MEYYDDDIIARSNSLTNKYKPQKIEDIAGNTKAVAQIVAWLKGFAENKKKVLETQNKVGKKKKKSKVKIPKIKQDDDNEELGYNENDVQKETCAENDRAADYNEAGDASQLEDEPNQQEEYYEQLEEVYQSSNKGAKNNNPKSCVIVTGNHGVGKTSSVHAILNDLGYTMQVINFSKIKTGKNVKDVIERITNTSDILKIMDGQQKLKNVIVIDELESLTSSTEKSCITMLIKHNELFWFCPIIFISNNQHNKLLSDIKKNSLEVRFWQPFPQEMVNTLKMIASKENIILKNSAVHYKIIEHCQRDFRRLIFILQDLKYAYGEEPISSEMIDDYCITSKKKDVDFDLFNATELLLHDYTCIDDCMRYYETEKVLLPLMIHQNYCKSIQAIMNDDDPEIYNHIGTISELLSKGDVVENYIYGDQNWDMHDVHGFYTCVATSFLLSDINSKHGSVGLDFPMDLNRTSIMKINRKNILNANKCLTNMNIHDYIYINQIVRKLLADGKNSECMKLFNGYGIKMEHIESLLKVDKIQSSKTNLAPKQKKELLNYLRS